MSDLRETIKGALCAWEIQQVSSTERILKINNCFDSETPQAADIEKFLENKVSSYFYSRQCRQSHLIGSVTIAGHHGGLLRIMPI